MSSSAIGLSDDLQTRYDQVLAELSRRTMWSNAEIARLTRINQEFAQATVKAESEVRRLELARQAKNVAIETLLTGPALTSAFEAKDARISELERACITAEEELRKYEPSDAVMMQLLALNECIREAARLLAKSGDVSRDMPEFIDAVDAWLKLPVVAQARKFVRGQ